MTTAPSVKRPAVPRPDPAGGAHPLAHGGPRTVAIGGGHGLATTLGALRGFAGEITAVTSVADDGGSSGRLRQAFGIPAPGDLRKCLVALLPGPSPLGDALDYRFSAGELDGHAFGNLLLAALAAGTSDFVTAVGEACRLLDTVGRVFPATASPVVLKAESAGSELEGQVAIMERGEVTRVSLVPADAAPPPEVLAAIGAADLVVLGPGSLYTSVLAALAPRGTAGALAQSRARLVYVCNLRPQEPETAGYDVAAHVGALIAHGIVPDVVVADLTTMGRGDVAPGVDVRAASVSADGGRLHDVGALAAVLEDLAF